MCWTKYLPRSRLYLENTKSVLHRIIYKYIYSTIRSLDLFLVRSCTSIMYLSQVLFVPFLSLLLYYLDTFILIIPTHFQNRIVYCWILASPISKDAAIKLIVMCIKIHYLYLPIFIDTDCTTNVSPSTNTVHIPHTLFFLSLGVLVVMGYAVNMQNLVRDSCRWLINYKLDLL